jgi:hypothetical protein
MPSKPRATFTEDFYRFEYEAEQVTLVLERLAEKRGGGGIGCELEITTGAPNVEGLIYSGNFNLLTSSKALANQCRDRLDVDWDGIFTQVAAVSKKRYREGEPVVDLATVEPSAHARWLVKGFVEDTTRPTLIAAGGGTGKSTIGVAVAGTVATGVPMLGIPPSRQCPVLYLDWEADASIHAERLQALWRGAGRSGEFPQGLIYYQRQVASLSESVATIRRRVAEEGIGFAVLDSVGMARGDDPNNAEATIKMFVANRKLGIPVLAIDHVSKEVLASKTRATAIGSVYTENNVCRVWVMKGVEQPGGGIALSLEDVKRNNTARQKTLAYVMHYLDDGTEDQRPVEIRYERKDFRDIPLETMPVNGGQKWRMAKVIEEHLGKPVPDSDIADALGIDEKQVRALLSRHSDMFVRVEGQGIARVAKDGQW